MTEQQPDHTDTGEERDVGQGYPEEQHGGAGGGERPAPDRGGEGPTGDEPEDDPGKATGNPDAAG
jgi:hypothetical protein